MSIVCALVVRLSADLLKPSIPVTAVGGPAAILGLYAIILVLTGRYRTLAEMRNKLGQIDETVASSRVEAPSHRSRAAATLRRLVLQAKQDNGILGQAGRPQCANA